MPEIAEINIEKYYGKGKSGRVERTGDLDTLLLELIVVANELVRKMNKLEYREWKIKHGDSGKDFLIYKGEYKEPKPQVRV